MRPCCHFIKAHRTRKVDRAAFPHLAKLLRHQVLLRELAVEVTVSAVSWAHYCFEDYFYFSGSFDLISLILLLLLFDAFYIEQYRIRGGISFWAAASIGDEVL